MRLLNEKNGAKLTVDQTSLTSEGFDFSIVMDGKTLSANVAIKGKVRGYSQVGFNILKDGRFLSSDDYAMINESGLYSAIADVATATYLTKNRKKKAFNEMSSMAMMSKSKAKRFYESFKKNSPEKCPEIYESIESKENWCFVGGDVKKLIPVSEFSGIASSILSIAFERAAGFDGFLKTN